MKYSTSVQAPTLFEQRLFKRVPKPLSYDNLFVETFHSIEISWDLLARSPIVQKRASLVEDPIVTELAPTYPPRVDKHEKSVVVGTLQHCGTEWSIRVSASYQHEQPKSLGLHLVANNDIVPGKFVVTVGFCLWNPETRQKRTDYKRDKLGATGWSFPKFYPLSGYELPLRLMSEGVSKLAVYLRFDLKANALYPLTQPSVEVVRKLGASDLSLIVEWDTRQDSYVTCPVFEFAGGLFRLLYSYSPPMFMVQRLPGGSVPITLAVSVLTSRKVYSFSHEYLPGFNDFGLVGSSLGKRSNFVVRLQNCIVEEPPMFRAVVSHHSEVLPAYGFN